MENTKDKDKEKFNVLCPNCFNSKLNKKDEKTATCNNCNENFQIVSATSVRFL